MVEVIWGDDGPDGRRVIANGQFTGRKGLWARMPGKRIFERDQTTVKDPSTGEPPWVLIRYSRTGARRLTLKNWIVILKGDAGPARLKDGVIIDDDPDLFEEIT